MNIFSDSDYLDQRYLGVALPSYMNVIVFGPSHVARLNARSENIRCFVVGSSTASDLKGSIFPVQIAPQ